MKTLSADRAIDIPSIYAPAGLYPNVIRSSHYVRLSDGVRIAIDLYLPDPMGEQDQLPAILLQTRYWRSFKFRPEVPRNPADPLSMEKMSGYKRRFLAQGYAWIDMDVRGTGASFGCRVTEFSEQEIRDGSEMVDWILQQPWSNKKVGALGISYEGTTAELLLANCHPAVRAVAPMFSLFDVYTDVAFPGGIRSDWFLNTWSGINEVLDRNEVPGPFPKTVLGVCPVDEDANGDLLAAAVSEHSQNVSVHRQIAGIVHRDDPSTSGAIESLDQLSSFSKQERMAASGGAIYSISGWFDGGYPHAAIKRFLTIQTPGSKLLLGPWNHAGEINISPFGGGPAGFDLPGELLKFFDFHLKGVDTGIDSEQPIYYFTMGEERWKGAETWPPVESTQTLYFGPLGKLQSEQPVDGGEYDLYKVDFDAGTGDKTRWNSLMGMPMDTPYPDRTEQDQRLLCYSSEPLTEDCEITGHPVLHLYLQVNQSQTDVFVYLEDVDPQGMVAYVTEGMLRTTHRALSTGRALYQTPAPTHSYRREDSQPLQAGETIHLVIDLLPTSYIFGKSHSIRIAIAGADKDHFLPQTVEEQVWKVLRDRHNSSQLIIPCKINGNCHDLATGRRGTHE